MLLDDRNPNDINEQLLSQAPAKQDTKGIDTNNNDRCSGSSVLYV